MSYWLIFLTGLTSGGLSCVAMQGGLLASAIANQKGVEINNPNTKSNTAVGSFDQLDWFPAILFLLSKLIAHTLLGFLLGWLGSRLQLSLEIRLLFQGLAAAFMLATALNLLEVHPIFRYVLFQPPRFIRKLLKNSTRRQAFFTPAVLGFLTILIPCGVTQSMEVLAISSGGAVRGALLMFFFVLGTSPIFAAVGVATAKLSEVFKDRFMKIAAATLIFLAVSSLNGILVVLDSPITVQKITEPVRFFLSGGVYNKQNTARLQQQKNTQMPTTRKPGPVQKITINVTSNGYSPNRLQVQSGSPVELTVSTHDTYSCASFFTFASFGINLQLGPNESKSVTFTPTKPGMYQFSCSMGMYTGQLEVI